MEAACLMGKASTMPELPSWLQAGREKKTLPLLHIKYKYPFEKWAKMDGCWQSQTKQPVRAATNSYAKMAIVLENGELN